MKPVPSLEEINDVAIELGVHPSFVEKDWYAVQVLGLIVSYTAEGGKAVFSGGTSLSKGYGLIQRFSEDMDFKVQSRVGLSRKARKDYRAGMIDFISSQHELVVDDNSLISRNESQFFSFNIAYPQRQELDQSLRPFLKLEFSFLNPALPTEVCSIRSFISHLKKGEADAVIHCVSPVETAADKFSALVWRVLSKDRSADRGSIKNEPEMIRHLHDLCALEKYTTDSDFLKIVMSNYNHDKKRGGLAGKYALQDAVEQALTNLKNDKLYVGEYERFVEAMSYAPDNERIDYVSALAALGRIIGRVS